MLPPLKASPYTSISPWEICCDSLNVQNFSRPIPNQFTRASNLSESCQKVNCSLVESNQCQTMSNGSHSNHSNLFCTHGTHLHNSPVASLVLGGSSPTSSLLKACLNSKISRSRKCMKMSWLFYTKMHPNKKERPNEHRNVMVRLCDGTHDGFSFWGSQHSMKAT